MDSTPFLSSAHCRSDPLARSVLGRGVAQHALNLPSKEALGHA